MLQTIEKDEDTLARGFLKARADDRWRRGDGWRPEWRVAARIFLATFVPGVPFLIARVLLHEHSGVLNLDYLIVTLLACTNWIRLASALFVLTYALEFLRLLDTVYLFSQQDLAYVTRYVGDVPGWLVAVWLLAFVLVCALALKVWYLLLPEARGSRVIRAAIPLGVVFMIFLVIDMAQGFNPLLSLPHGKPREHLVGELLVRMPLGMIHAAARPEDAIVLKSSATQPLWGDSVIRRKRENVVVVVVESMGLLENKAARSREFAALDDEAIRKHYTVSEGSVPFTGATVAGEMRELCHLGTHVHITDQTLAGKGPCLPKQYGDLGYETAAFHGYRETMFQRGQWYRKIGFQEENFLGDLNAFAKCNGAFYGVCDGAVAEAMERRLAEKTAEGAPPQFLYWMTLTGHLPVDTNHAPAMVCPVKADEEVCAQLAYTEEVLDAVRQIALSGDGHTAIVIVGDHAPPYIAVDRRNLFSNSNVPFVTLMPKG